MEKQKLKNHLREATALPDGNFAPTHASGWLVNYRGWLRQYACATLVLFLSAGFAVAQGPPNILWMRGGFTYLEGLAYSPDGQMVATANGPEGAKLWSTSTGRLLNILPTSGMPEDETRSVAFSPDGKTIATGGSEVNFWRVADGTLLRTFADGCCVGGISFSPDGSIVAAVTFDALGLKFWRVSDGTLLMNRTDIGQNAISFSPDGTSFVTNGTKGGYGFLGLFQTSDGSLIKELGNRDGGDSFAFLPAGLIAAVGARVNFYNETTGALVNSLSGFTSTSISLSPDGQTLAVGASLPSGNSSVNLYHTSDYSLINSISLPAYSTAYQVAFSPDGKSLTVGTETSISLYKAGNGSLIRNLSVVRPGPALYACVAFSNDGQTVAIGDYSGTVTLFERADGSVIRTLSPLAPPRNEGPVCSLAFSADGTLLASTSRTTDSGNAPETRVWRVADGTLVRTFGWPVGGPQGYAAFSPDGNYAAFGGPDNLAVFSVADGSQLFMLAESSFGTPAISPDSQKVANASYNGITISQIPSGQEIAQFYPQGPHFLQFSPNGQTLLAGNGNDIDLQNASDGSLIRVLSGHTDSVVSASWSPDGQTIASVSNDGTLRLWRVSDGIQVYKQDIGKPAAYLYPGLVTYSPDGKLIAYTTSDPTVVVISNPLPVSPIVPAVTLSASQLAFGTQTLNTASPAQTATVTNTGTAILHISSIALTGNNSSDFGQTYNCGESLPPGGTCAINITFQPVASGGRTATLTLTDNAGDSPQSVALTGAGASPAVPEATLSATALVFGSQTVNTASAPQILTLTNSGTAPLTITGITLSGTNNTDFSETSTCGASLAASTTCTISVVFQPLADGARTATLGITSNSVNLPVSVALTGTGVSADVPVIPAGSIGPIFSASTMIQPGSWVSIFGSNLASGTAVWNGDFPTSLGGVSVTIHGKPAYLWYVSPTQINLQAPDDATTGPVDVVLTNNLGTVKSSVTLGAVSPSFSLLGDGKHVAAVIPVSNGAGAYGDGTYDLVGPSGAFTFTTRPVKQGEVLVLYGVGFGPTDPAVPSGQSLSDAAPTVNTVTVTIGGIPAHVAFAGLVGAGLYQLNVTVPNTGSGDQALQATVNGTRTLSGPVVSVQ